MEPFCEWYEDDEGDWNTSCENKHVLLCGGPTHNRMTFCCYCGKRINEIERGEEDESPDYPDYAGGGR